MAPETGSHWTTGISGPNSGLEESSPGVASVRTNVPVVDQFSPSLFSLLARTRQYSVVSAGYVVELVNETESVFTSSIRVAKL